MKDKNTSKLSSVTSVDNSSFNHKDENNFKPKGKKKFIKNKILVGLSFVFVVTVSIIYFNFSSVDFEDLQYETINSKWYSSLIFNKTVYLKSTMLPFTGRINEKYYKGKFVDGKKHGVHKEFFAGGKLSKIGEYDNGIQIGSHKQWHSNGQLRFDLNYSNGSRVGSSKEYDSEGNLNRIDYNEGDILEYLNGYLVSPEYSFEDSFVSATSYRYNDYQFIFVKLDDDYLYGVIVENYTNIRPSSTASSQFEIGDIKFRASIISETVSEVEDSEMGSITLNNIKLEGFWRMANRDKVEIDIDLINRTSKPSGLNKSVMKIKGKLNFEDAVYESK